MAEPCVHPLFNDADADVICCSSDGVHFRLHKLILAKASVVFRDMLTLPEPEDHDQASPQVVDLQESSQTLADLLSYCYPMEQPELTVTANFGRIYPVLLAARKYEISFIVTILKRVLRTFAPELPLRVYAIAYILKDSPLARLAARHLLTIPDFFNSLTSWPELDFIPATALTAVGVYRRECAKAAVKAFADKKVHAAFPHGGQDFGHRGPPDMSEAWVWLRCTETSCKEGRSYIYVGRGHQGRGVHPRAWWRQYIDDGKEALELKPVGSTITSPAFLKTFVDEAAGCATCAPSAWSDLEVFAEMMARRINSAVNQVKIELPFS